MPLRGVRAEQSATGKKRGRNEQGQAENTSNCTPPDGLNLRYNFHHEVIHELGARSQRTKSPSSPSFPYGFSGNPGGIRTGPPIKHSGVTRVDVFLFSPAYF